LVSSFDSLRPGDRVRVTWPVQKKARAGEGYCEGGVVVQVTPRLVAIRSHAGYVFCVGVYHSAKIEHAIRRVK